MIHPFCVVKKVDMRFLERQTVLVLKQERIAVIAVSAGKDSQVIAAVFTSQLYLNLSPIKLTNRAFSVALFDIGFPQLAAPRPDILADRRIANGVTSAEDLLVDVYFPELLFGTPFQALEFVFSQADVNDRDNLLLQPAFTPVAAIVNWPLCQILAPGGAGVEQVFRGLGFKSLVLNNTGLGCI